MGETVPTLSQVMGPGEGMGRPIHVPTSHTMKLHSRSAGVSYSHASPRLIQRLDGSRWIPWGHAPFHPLTMLSNCFLSKAWGPHYSVWVLVLKGLGTSHHNRRL